MLRMVTLVNEKDEVVGQTDLLSAHQGKGKKHRAISWFLFRKSEHKKGAYELLLQQRSSYKIVGANLWANTLCANVAPGESHLECLRRRSGEELGLTWNKEWLTEEVMVLDYQVACEPGFSENELDHFFVTILTSGQNENFFVSPNPEEVAELRWLSWEAVNNKEFPQAMKIAPWFRLFLDNNQVIQAINQGLGL